MNKIIIIGCPGSGKSVFARALHEKTKIPLYHLDMMFWKPDKTTVEKSVVLEGLRAAMQTDEWIIDGNYASTLEERLGACNVVFFLDYPLSVCLDGVKARRQKPRSDMPWIETEDDAEFIAYINSFNEKQRPRIIELLEGAVDKKIFVFKNRSQSQDFLENRIGELK